MAEQRLEGVKKALKICQGIKIGGQCPNSCPLLAACQMGCGGAPRMILDCIQQLEKRIIHLEALNQQNLSVITMQERTRARLEERISQLDSCIPRWISVEERLPDETDLNDQLVYCHAPINGHRWIQLAHILHDTSDDVRIWMDSEGYTVNTVTHWMELPEPPEEVQTDG